MADVLNTVAEVLTSQRRVSGVLAGELAGPRATARLLAALPAVGVGLGMVLGGDPGGFLLHHPIGQVALLAGVALACAGLAWVDRISGKDQVT